MNLTYLDNNATTCVAPEVTEAMLPFFTTQWGNPSSMYPFGGEVAKWVDAAREEIAACIGATPGEIIFTSCGTESNNQALFGTAEFYGRELTVITSKVEHPAILGPCRRLQERGHRIVEIPVDGVGQLDMDAYREALAISGKKLVSIMWANNETGVIFPIAEITRLARDAGAIIHTDAVQAMGKVPVNVSDVPVDMLSFSGHKIHAPKGVGVLYVRRGTRLKTFMIGGHQENGRRGGTENVPYIVGLAKACRLAVESLGDEATRVAALRDKLEKGLLATCLDSRVNGDVNNRVPNTTDMSFEFIEGESILYMLADLGICASSGSACAAGSLEPSHVIRAMGVPFTAVHGSIRFSLSRYTTEAEIDYTLKHMPGIVNRLRELSPFVK